LHRGQCEELSKLGGNYALKWGHRFSGF